MLYCLNCGVVKIIRAIKFVLIKPHRRWHLQVNVCHFDEKRTSQAELYLDKWGPWLLASLPPSVVIKIHLAILARCYHCYIAQGDLCSFGCNTCVFSPSRKAEATLCRRNVPKSRSFLDSFRGHSSHSFKNRRYLVADIFGYVLHTLLWKDVLKIDLYRAPLCVLH